MKEVFDWDWDRAEREYKRAIDLNPEYATAHHRYAVFLCWRGRVEDAISELRRAQRLEPTSLIINADLGLALYFARRFDEAADQLRKTLELQPDFARAHSYLLDVYVAQRRFDDAIAQAQTAAALSGERRGDVLLSYAYAAAGRTAEARKTLALYAARNRGQFIQPLSTAVTDSLLHDNDRAFATLERGYRERASAMLRLRVDPKADALRLDPRFELILRRIGL